MGPGHYRTEIRRGVKRGSSLTACRFAGYARRSAGVMKWQTCQTQNLVGGNARVGSSPTAGKQALSSSQGVRLRLFTVEESAGSALVGSDVRTGCFQRFEPPDAGAASNLAQIGANLHYGSSPMYVIEESRIKDKT